MARLGVLVTVPSIAYVVVTTPILSRDANSRIQGLVVERIIALIDSTVLNSLAQLNQYGVWHDICCVLIINSCGNRIQSPLTNSLMTILLMKWLRL